MKKIKFTFTKADSKTRTMGIIALVLAVAAIVLLVVSATSALNRSITELPIIKTLVPEEQLDDVTETYDELIEEIEAAIDEEDDELLEELEDEKLNDLDFIELNCCTGGCVGGAGQPYALMGRKLQRAAGLYEIDRSSMFKRPQRNPVINSMYAEGLGERHDLLHSHHGEEGAHEE